MALVDNHGVLTARSVRLHGTAWIYGVHYHYAGTMQKLDDLQSPLNLPRITAAIVNGKWHECATLVTIHHCRQK